MGATAFRWNAFLKGLDFEWEQVSARELSDQRRRGVAWLTVNYAPRLGRPAWLRELYTVRVLVPHAGRAARGRRQEIRPAPHRPRPQARLPRGAAGRGRPGGRPRTAAADRAVHRAALSPLAFAVDSPNARTPRSALLPLRLWRRRLHAARHHQPAARRQSAPHTDRWCGDGRILAARRRAAAGRAGPPSGALRLPAAQRGMVGKGGKTCIRSPRGTREPRLTSIIIARRSRIRG
eukprot:2370302-Prymnesium_polylepis.1